MQSRRMNVNTEGKDNTEEEEETTDEEAVITTDDTTIVDAVITDGITTTTIVDAGIENQRRRDRVGCPRGTWMKTDDRRTADSARGVA